MPENQNQSINIVVPELGESVLDATIGRWLKHEGEHVAAGDAVVELETDKVNLEVSAAHAGILASIQRHEQEDVHVGDVLGVIIPEQAGPVSPVQVPDGNKEVEKKPSLEEKAGQAVSAEMATPVARRFAQEHAVDLSQVHGSGPGGRVTKSDVESSLAAQMEKPASPAPLQEQVPAPYPEPRFKLAPADRLEERIKMSRRRRTIASRLVEAQHTAAMLTTFNEVDMTAVMDLRARRNQAFQARNGVKLGVVSFFIKATTGALKSFPLLNAELQGDEMVIKHYYDIGVAIGDSQGLVVPILRDADRLSFAEIELRIRELAQKTENGTLSLDDLRGGTFTITNGGVFGSLMSTPILTPPQVGILGLHKIEKRPVAIDNQIAIRQMMYLALSYDHRIVDGREAVQFLVRIKELIEDPENLLLGT
jgi:2-oxoglutarate dehydrogenase E2 component (dihydrolipoamide succinyltransferase)